MKIVKKKIMVVIWAVIIICGNGLLTPLVGQILGPTSSTQCLIPIGSSGCINIGIPIPGLPGGGGSGGGGRPLLGNSSSTTTTSSTTSTSSSGGPLTTSGKPVPSIVPTPSTVPPPPPPATTEPKQEGMSKNDMNILKWLLANEPDKPLEGIGIKTQIVKALLKIPQVREALEALRQKLQNLDSQDPNDPHVQKIVKDVRKTLMKQLARLKFKNIMNRKAKTPVSLPKNIAVGVAPGQPLPLPARPIITPEHKTVVTPSTPPPPSTDNIIEPPPESSSTTTTTTTTTTTRGGGGGMDPTAMMFWNLIQQLIQQKQNSDNLPQEIKELAEVLKKASEKCKEGIGKQPGGTSLLNEIKSILEKDKPTDSDKSRAKELKTEFCNMAANVSDCAGVCGGSSQPSNPLEKCKTYTGCTECPNSDAKIICQFYNNNILGGAGQDCKSNIGQYSDPAWFNQFLTGKPSDSEITTKKQEMKNTVCRYCREIITTKNSTFCD